MLTSSRRHLVVFIILTAIFALIAPSTVSAATVRKRKVAKHPVVAAAATATATNCGGTSIRKGDGTPWACTWDDEFNGTSIDSAKWTAQTTAASGFLNGPVGCFVNTANNVAVANGVLSLTARKEATPFTCKSPNGSFSTQYTTGELMSYGKFSQTYGRFEVRAKFPASAIAGLQSSLWLFPQNFAKFGMWPRSGEIDIAEEYSKYADRAIPYVHYVPAAFDPNVTNNYCTVSNVNAFHTYAVEWTSSTITVSFDGKQCIKDTYRAALPLNAPEPFNQPFNVALTQALGIGANAFNPATTQLPATTQIDYVRVWS